MGASPATLPDFLPENWHARNWPLPLAIAVSGGGDSVSCLHFLAAELPKNQLFILHFDHNLRADSAGDAEFVRNLAESLGIRFLSAEWSEKPSGNLQQAARQARYKFFEEAGKKHGFNTVVLAHTEDDVAETVLMRLGKGSGVTGLASLAEETQRGELTLLRPLLQVSRADLRKWLRENNIPWREDPSNENTKFQRIRVRQLKTALKEAGIPFSSIAASARACQRAKQALTASTHQAAERYLQLENGAAVLEEAFLDLPDEIALNLLAMALLKVQPAGMAPRTSKRQRALESIRSGALPCTLGGVQIQSCEKGVKLVALPLAKAAVGA